MKAPAASVYKKVIDAMERERREEEKMYSAIQQGAGRKAIEAVRADSSMQMKTILAELNMEQFRRVPLYEWEGYRLSVSTHANRSALVELELNTFPCLVSDNFHN